MTRILLFGALLLGAAQLVPVDRSNPAVRSDVAAPEPIAALLRRACYDCHSHETRWPWYGYVAPVSWLLARDVEHGREHLNFSTWNEYTPDQQREHREEAYEEAEEGHMPPWFYLPLHRDARLAPTDLEALRTWARESETTPAGEARESETTPAGEARESETTPAGEARESASAPTGAAS